jgi:hypothetical protein
VEFVLMELTEWAKEDLEEMLDNLGLGLGLGLGLTDLFFLKTLPSLERKDARFFFSGP